jgi:hypothetical protein
VSLHGHRLPNDKQSMVAVETGASSGRFVGAGGFIVTVNPSAGAAQAERRKKIIAKTDIFFFIFHR